MPLLAPVTITTLPCISPICTLRLFCLIW
jgi:hypothetical protein